MEKVRELYQLYEKRIFRYFLGLTLNYHVAEELTQETFFQVLRTFYRFRGDSQVTTWLYGTARNVYRTWKRKQALSPLPLEQEIIDLPDPNEPSSILEEKESLKLILNVLTDMPEKQREVIWLREYQDLSYEEIAVVMERSLAWVKVTLHRARSNFQNIYNERRKDAQ